ncbi:MAG TPA: YihY/virulence factor BrkB family protein [Bacteroidales bacterium]|nr:YihY/virulence factor BrkB family protein [Bacteroidales bacterium]
MKKPRFKMWLDVTKTMFSSFIDDKGPKLSASLAYYTIFSLPALLVVVIGLGSIFFGKQAIEGDVMSHLSGALGKETAAQVQEMLKNTSQDYDNIWATIIGAATLLFLASTIFAEIQDSINQIWGLKAKPKKGLMNFLFNRLLSFSMVLVLGFILLISSILNALLAAFIETLKGYFPSGLVNSLLIIDYIVVLLVVIILFAAIFKILPDAKIKHRDVLTGAVITTILFVIGRFIIGFYLKNYANISVYGAAGSVVVILLWVYYTSMILYLGAEFTQAYMQHSGKTIEPYKYAIKINPVKPVEDTPSKKL